MIRADYLCPEHGHFEAAVESPSPDEMPCPELVHEEGFDDGDGDGNPCRLASPWSPTKMHGKVKAWEVERGGWEKPERQSFLDTRELGEGQDIQDFREKRSAIRDQERKAAVMEMLK